jgi:hypothetical protein
LEKIATKRSIPGKALHAFELGAKHIGRILEPDDQVGDIGLHHPLLAQDILDTGIFDVELGVAKFCVRVREPLQHLAGHLDLRPHVVDDGSGLFDFRVERLDVGHVQFPCFRAREPGVPVTRPVAPDTVALVAPV